MRGNGLVFALLSLALLSAAAALEVVYEVHWTPEEMAARAVFYKKRRARSALYGCLLIGIPFALLFYAAVIFFIALGISEVVGERRAARRKRENEVALEDWRRTRNTTTNTTAATNAAANADVEHLGGGDKHAAGEAGPSAVRFGEYVLPNPNATVPGSSDTKHANGESPADSSPGAAPSAADADDEAPPAYRPPSVAPSYHSVNPFTGNPLPPRRPGIKGWILLFLSLGGIHRTRASPLVSSGTGTVTTSLAATVTSSSAHALHLPRVPQATVPPASAVSSVSAALPGLTTTLRAPDTEEKKCFEDCTYSDVGAVVVMDTHGNKWTGTAGAPDVVTVTTTAVPGGMITPFRGWAEPRAADMTAKVDLLIKVLIPVVYAPAAVSVLVFCMVIFT